MDSLAYAIIERFGDGSWYQVSEIAEAFRLQKKTVASAFFPGGVLIDNAPWDHTGAAAATKQAIKAGATVIFEAAFLASAGSEGCCDVPRR